MVGAIAARHKNAAGNGVHITVLRDGTPCSDQRAARHSRFGDDRAHTDAADDAVALRKRSAARYAAGIILAQNQTLGLDLGKQSFILEGIYAVDGCTEHGNGVTAGAQRRAVIPSAPFASPLTTKAPLLASS